MRSLVRRGRGLLGRCARHGWHSARAGRHRLVRSAGYRKGWFALRQLNLNINALMSVAVTGALLLGQWPEAAMVMVLFALAELAMPSKA